MVEENIIFTGKKISKDRLHKISFYAAIHSKLEDLIKILNELDIDLYNDYREQNYLDRHNRDHYRFQTLISDKIQWMYKTEEFKSFRDFLDQPAVLKDNGDVITLAGKIAERAATPTLCYKDIVNSAGITLETAAVIKKDGTIVNVAGYLTELSFRKHGQLNTKFDIDTKIDSLKRFGIDSPEHIASTNDGAKTAISGHLIDLGFDKSTALSPLENIFEPRKITKDTTAYICANGAKITMEQYTPEGKATKKAEGYKSNDEKRENNPSPKLNNTTTYKKDKDCYIA